MQEKTCPANSQCALTSGKREIKTVICMYPRPSKAIPDLASMWSSSPWAPTTSWKLSARKTCPLSRVVLHLCSHRSCERECGRGTSASASVSVSVTESVSMNTSARMRARASTSASASMSVSVGVVLLLCSLFHIHTRVVLDQQSVSLICHLYDWLSHSSVRLRRV